MKYVMQTTFLGPEGDLQGREFWVAKDEAEMEALLDADIGPYCACFCLGPQVEIREWAREKLPKENKV